jgi:hypothetical protein
MRSNGIFQTTTVVLYMAKFVVSIIDVVIRLLRKQSVLRYLSMSSLAPNVEALCRAIPLRLPQIHVAQLKRRMGIFLALNLYFQP